MKLECLTIVFVDIKDYTSKTNDHSRQANESLLARFAALVKPLVRSFHGTVIKAIGDAYLISFKSPTDSLLCAMAVLDQLARRNAQLPPDLRFELRFAINAGEVRLDRGDVFGEAVNVAARVEGLAAGGEIYFTETVYLMMNKSEVPFEEVGLRKLKGIQQEVRVYRVPKLAEVGVYQLAPAEGAVEEEAAGPQPHALPYGGLALRRVDAGWDDAEGDAEGAFYLGAALMEAHDAAATRAGRFADAWWRRALAPGYYAALWLGAMAGLAFKAATYRGLRARGRRTLRLLGSNSAYRGKALSALLLALLLLGAAFLGWRQHRLALQAQQQAQALQLLVEQKEAAASKAKAREAQAQQALKKEQGKFHLPW
jgi:class 3 adenylate cyclase